VTLTGFGIVSLFPTPFIQQALATVGTSDKRLLFLFLRGGNDGINAVIPHGDPDYSPVHRPTLHVPYSAPYDLNGFASLHPSLGSLLEPFQAGELAVVHRVGYANNSRSHFDGQRIWENGDPTQAQLFEGWLYRYVHEQALSQGAILPVLSVQATPPLLLRGAEKFVNVANPESFDYIVADPKRTKYKTRWREVYQGLQGLEAYRPILSQTGVKLADTLDEYASWSQATWNPLDPDNGWSLFPVSTETNQAGFSTSSFEFFRSVKVCALSLLESTGGSLNGTRVAGTQLTGWDTHSGQGGVHADLMSWLAHALRSLRIVLSGAATDPRAYPSIWQDTVVVTLSEFGRTTNENGSGGTDHAAASCLFVTGGAVNGGVYNCDASTWPQGVMYGVNGRYLLERTDYRAIFWEILRDHMGASPAAVEGVFPGYTAAGLDAQELGLVG
jgi:uncharacterized protein (DUF1501 family)